VKTRGAEARAGRLRRRSPILEGAEGAGVSQASQVTQELINVKAHPRGRARAGVQGSVEPRATRRHLVGGGRAGRHVAGGGPPADFDLSRRDGAAPEQVLEIFLSGRRGFADPRRALQHGQR